MHVNVHNETLVKDNVHVDGYSQVHDLGGSLNTPDLGDFFWFFLAKFGFYDPKLP